jgi:hypothetical protein
MARHFFVESMEEKFLWPILELLKSHSDTRVASRARDDYENVLLKGVEGLTKLLHRPLMEISHFKALSSISAIMTLVKN